MGCIIAGSCSLAVKQGQNRGENTYWLTHVVATLVTLTRRGPRIFHYAHDFERLSVLGLKVVMIAAETRAAHQRTGYSYRMVPAAELMVSGTFGLFAQHSGGCEESADGG
jgi:hypothetical protein